MAREDCQPAIRNRKRRLGETLAGNGGSCYLGRMHSPGVCGAILTTSSPVGPSSAPTQSSMPARSRADALGALIDVLHADTEIVVIAAGEDADALAPAVWARAGYLVQLAPGANQADGLRAILQDVLNRGRDAVLVTTLDGPALTAKTVQRMVAEYLEAGDEVWAVVPEALITEAGTPESGAPESGAPDSETQPGGQRSGPMLLGRRMIELFLRGRQWRTAEELLTTHREHVRTLKLESRERSV
jgi:hypothetical protein